MSAANRILTELEARDCHPRGVKPGEYKAHCPAHNDRNPSLSITRADEKVLLHCFANCTVEDVLAALGLEKQHLYDDFYDSSRLVKVVTEGSPAAIDGMPDWYDEPIIQVYDYHDENGRVLYRVGRTASKQFPVFHPNGNGGWKPGLNGARRVLYRLPEVLAAVEKGEPIHFPEGEKDADNLRAKGVVATTNPGGAKKWRPEYADALRGAHVRLIADRDDPGREHVARVAEALDGIAATVELYEPAEGKDVSDHLAAGRSLDELVPLNGDAPSESLDGAALLSELRSFVARFMVLPSEQAADLVALWILHTHAFEGSWATPYLRVVSATPECGKTLFLEILAALTRRGWHAVNPSVAVLYRKIDKQTPTLLLDEMDNYPLEDRKDALAVLNSGYRPGLMVPRCKENGDLEEFRVYCPKAYAGIDSRQLVSTLLSRSITIRLEKRLPSEKVERWIAPLTEPKAIPLREHCEAWAEQNAEALLPMEPELPAGMDDRPAEVWWALLNIADRVGGDWPARARAAWDALSTGGDATDDVPVQVQLLADIAEALGDEDTISTADLLAYLNELEESPWGSRRKGEGLDARTLAKLLRPFKIKPRTVRVGDATLKGYHSEQFQEVFARHLPEASQASQASHSAPRLEPDVTDVTDVTDFQGSDDPAAELERIERKWGGAA